ncbi:MAG: pilus assembly protein PilM [Lachnospiraceae bacterium]|nr:pilus assembly protein PilM [Lachnospiraceae bacterium]
MARVLSFEVGQGTTKCVEMDYKTKNPKIYNMFTIETPEEVVQDGVVARNEEFIVAVKSELRRRQIKTKAAVFTVASGRIANREARIPYCKPNKIMQLVTANASDYFPVDMNQYHLVYNVLGEAVDENGTKQYRLSLLAVPNDVTTSYLDFSKSLELEIKAIDYVGNSVFQAVREDVAGTTTAFLKIEEHASLITVVHQGEIILQRQIAHGLNQAIMNLMESDIFEGEELSYAGASRKFVENRIIRPHLNLDAGVSAEDANEEDLMVRVMITESLRYLVGNIGRVIEYFVSRNEDKPLSNIYVVGLGADFQGLPELLSNELGHNIRVYEGLNKFTAINVDPNAPSVSMNQMIGPIGAGMSPLQLLNSDLLKEEKEINLLIPAAVMILGIVAAIIMVIYGKAKLSAAEKETKEKEETLRSYDYVAEKIANYDATKVTYDQLVTMFNVGDNWNNDLVNFMNELEVKMPKSFKIAGLDIQPDSITMDIVTDDKNEVAKAIEQLREFRSYQLISIDRAEEGDAVEMEEQIGPEGEVTLVPKEDGETITAVAIQLVYSYKPWTGSIDETENNEESADVQNK